MALDVYFKQDIANVARALGQNRGTSAFAIGYRAALVDVAMAFGIDMEVTQGVHIIDSRDHTRQLILGPGSGDKDSGTA